MSEGEYEWPAPGEGGYVHLPGQIRQDHGIARSRTLQRRKTYLVKSLERSPFATSPDRAS